MKKNIEIQILELMKEEKAPVGAIVLSKNLSIPQTTIGRVLLELEVKELIEKNSNKGRVITEKGLNYLISIQEEINKVDVAITMANIYNDISKEKLIEILGVRKIIEERIVELACENGTEEDMKELEIIFEEHQIEVKSNRLGNEEDLQLHLKLAKMSGNHTLYNLCKLLLTNDNAYTKFSIVTEDIKLSQLDQHKKIVEAVKNRNKEEAKINIISHLNQIIKDVKKNM